MKDGYRHNRGFVAFFLCLLSLGLVPSTPAQAFGERLKAWREHRQEQSSDTGQRVLHNQAYGNDPAQRFDVYLPGRAEGAPIIFMVHGGAWKIGDKAYDRVVENKVARWVSRGFILVSVNYRMLPQAKPDVQLKDVAQALARVQEMAAGWGGDPRRVLLMGHSAGGHLVALLGAGATPNFHKALLPVLGTVALDSAVMDLPAMMEAPHLRLYDEPFGTDPAYWQAMSPIHHLAAGAAPLLSVCSSRRDISCEQAKAFVGKAKALGIQAKVLPEDLSHGEINSTLGENNAYTQAVEAFMGELDAGVAQRLR